MEMLLNRRSFLKLASFFGVALSATSVFPSNLSKKETSQQSDIVDVHHHILPQVYRKALEKMGITSAGGVPFPSWNAERSLVVMDSNGISTAITSISAPGVYFGNSEFSRDLARQCNEFSANLVKDNPKRFGGFAVLPLPDVMAALKELEYSLDVLKLDGIVLLTNVEGHYLGDPKFNDLFFELNRRKAIVYVHPTVPFQEKFPKMNIPPSLFEFVFDTTRAISNLILNNTPEHFPEIRFIFSHAGGTAPYLAWKISLLDYSRGDYRINAIDQLKKFYYDTALSASPYALRSLEELVDSSHIVFGSDFPFAPEFLTSASISGLKEYDGFDEKKLKAIYRATALNMFPRLITK